MSMSPFRVCVALVCVLLIVPSYAITEKQGPSKTPLQIVKTAELQIDEAVDAQNKTTPGVECVGLKDCDACVGIHYCAWLPVNGTCIIAAEASHDDKPCHSCDHSTPAPPTLPAPTLPPTLPPTLIKATVIPGLVAPQVDAPGEPKPTPTPAPVQVLHCVDGNGCPLPAVPHDVHEAELKNLAGMDVTAVAIDVSEPSHVISHGEEAVVIASTVATTVPATQPPTQPVEIIADSHVNFMTSIQSKLTAVQQRVQQIEDALQHPHDHSLESALAGLVAAAGQQANDTPAMQHVHEQVLGHVTESKQVIDQLLKEVADHIAAQPTGTVVSSFLQMEASVKLVPAIIGQPNSGYEPQYVDTL